MKNSHFFPKNTFVHFKFMREGFQVMLYGLMMKRKNCMVYDGKWSRTTMVSLKGERGLELQDIRRKIVVISYG